MSAEAPETVTRTPGRKHQEICFRLIALLKAQAGPSQIVSGGWGWQPPTLPPVELIPDVMVAPATDDKAWFRGVPLLAVEVVDTRRVGDLVVKATTYARHGLEDLWVIDPEAHQVATYRLVDGTYETTGEHSHGLATLRYADTVVGVNVDHLFS